MSLLLAIKALICAAICLRVILYRKSGSTHRPLASALAYCIVVASGWVVITALLGKAPEPSLAETALLAVLCLALFASRGNVVEIFHTTAAENRIYRLIRRTRHA